MLGNRSCCDRCRTEYLTQLQPILSHARLPVDLASEHDTMEASKLEENRVETGPFEGTANDYGYLALAREVAQTAAQSVDLDGCFRTLRAGLVRLGFKRAGIWVMDPEVEGFLQGTWGTGWHGEEVDEHAVRLPVGRFVASNQIAAGEMVVLHHLEPPSNPSGAAHQALILSDGPPNNACVALRVDNRLLGIVSVDMLPGDGTIPPHSVAMLELLAGIAATAIARARLVTALQTTNQVLIAEIAERQRAEQQVVQRERRHRLLIESTYDVYAVINRDGTIQDVSPSIERVFGYSIDEMIERPFTMIVHPEDKAVYDDQFQKILPRPRLPFSGERRYRTKNRGWRTFEVVGVNYLDDPAVNGIIVTFRDVTERRQLEEQLRQAQKMEAIGRLAGGVAHDFNNLLTVINGYANLLVNGIPDPAQERRAIEQIRQASENAATLTSQLLAFGRRQMVTLQEIDLNAIVDHSVPMLRRLLGEKIILVSHLTPDLGLVMVDPRQIEQVLLNLSANARDAMPRGGTLTIETARVGCDEADRDVASASGGGERVLLRVSDTGMGMDAAALAHLFEPFYTTKEVGKGAGLGLAAVYGIVNQSGGTIAASSTPGQGTTFRISFPRVDRAQPEPPKQTRQEVVPRGDETILVIEDEDELRELVQRVLEMNGYHVLAAEDGDQARAIAERYAGTIHLVLTDVVMPGPSGREVVETLLQQRPALGVLYTSGYTEDEVLRHGVREADVAFLPKPFTPRELTQKVRAVLDAEER